MKKIILSLAFAIASYVLHAQNTFPFPATGSVGIGTTNPNASLHIVDAGTSASIPLQLNNRMIFRGDGVLNWGNAGDYGTLSWTGSKTLIGSQTGKNLVLLADNSEKVTIMSSGFVGIGTSTPGEKLEVNGNIALSGGAKEIHFNDVNNLTKQYLWLTSINSLGLGVGAGTNSMFIASDGNVSIGTTDPQGYKLAVKGNIHTQEIKVDMTGWGDYVFKSTYKLPTLLEVKNYIDQHQHLPEMPSATEVEKNGVNLGEMVKLQTKKIEELTLYLIQENKKKKEQQQINQLQQTKLDKLEKQIKQLTKLIKAK